MSYGKNRPNTWSDCSNEDFKEWYKTKGFACFAKDVQQLSCGADLVEVEFGFQIFMFNFSEAAS